MLVFKQLCAFFKAHCSILMFAGWVRWVIILKVVLNKVGQLAQMKVLFTYLGSFLFCIFDDTKGTNALAYLSVVSVTKKQIWLDTRTVCWHNNGSGHCHMGQNFRGWLWVVSGLFFESLVLQWLWLLSLLSPLLLVCWRKCCKTCSRHCQLMT